jgi:soluble lytic murein transglycosylase
MGLGKSAGGWRRRKVLLAAVAAAGIGVACGGAARADSDAEERLAQAVQAMGRGDWRWARKTIDQLGAKPLSLYARWRELLEADDRPPFSAYADFMRQHPDWPSLGTMQQRAEEQIDEDVPYEDRLAFFADREPRTRQGRVRYAQALLSVGRTGEAAELLRQSWIGDDFPPTELAYFLGHYREYLRTQDHEARLDRLLWDGNLKDAQRMRPLVRKDRELLAVARIRLQGLERKADAAVAEVPRGLQGDPGLLFDELRWYRRRGKDAEAGAILARPPADLERPELWWREQQRAIYDLIADGSFGRAYQIAGAHHQHEGTPFADGEWVAGWLALRFLRQPDLAQRHFERLWQGVTTPISKGRAAYWAGRAAEAAGQKAAARTWYERGARFPATFYGQLAARKAGEDLGALLAPKAAASAAAREELRRREPAIVARLLCRLDENALAQPFFRHLGVTAARSADSLRAVAELAEECGRPDLAVIAAKAATKEGADVEPRTAFPTTSVRALRVEDDSLPEPALRLAVARQESQFDPTVASAAGALGLMQVLPATAHAMCGDLGLPFSKSRLTRDAEYNARIGSSYLRRELDRYDGSPALALAAYNAGPTRVEEWLKDYGDPRGRSVEELVDWIELIPFAETRNYVQRVLEAREVYAVLLRRERGGSGQSAAAGTAARPQT